MRCAVWKWWIFNVHLYLMYSQKTFIKSRFVPWLPKGTRLILMWLCWEIKVDIFWLQRRWGGSGGFIYLLLFFLLFLFFIQSHEICGHFWLQRRWGEAVAVSLHPTPSSSLTASALTTQRHLLKVIVLIWTNTIWSLDNNYMKFGQIQFEIWTNIIWHLEKFNLKFGQQLFEIWTNTIWNLDKDNMHL